MSAQATCFGTNIHYVIRLAHHILVMLDHNHRVTHIAELLQRVNKTLIITLVQADTWFV